MNEPPKVIYLQFYENGIYAEGIEAKPAEEITWSAEPIYDDDVKYHHYSEVLGMARSIFDLLEIIDHHGNRVMQSHATDILRAHKLIENFPFYRSLHGRGFMEKGC